MPFVTICAVASLLYAQIAPIRYAKRDCAGELNVSKTPVAQGFNMKIPKDLKKNIQYSIYRCRNCFYDDELDLENNFITFRDFLEEIDCPRKYYSTIDGMFECRWCGSTISLDDDIVLPSQEEQEYDEVCEEISKGAYSSKLRKFAKYLEKYPYLGAYHSLGKEIIEGIEDMDLINIKNQNWYRARNSDDEILLKKKDMEPPNPTKVLIGEGRFNHYGQSHFYLGNTENTCYKEVSSEKHKFCWIQKINIVELNKVLDLSCIFSPAMSELNSLIFSSINYTGILTIPVLKDNNWKPEYFVPRFIADVAKMSGINAIKYKSSVSSGDNLVIFKFDKNVEKFIDKPYKYNYAEEEILF